MARDFSASYLQYADNPALDFTTEMTIAAWFNADSWAAGASEMVRKDGNYILRYEGGLSTSRFIWFDGSLVRYVEGGGAVSTGAWRHLVGQASANDAYRLYLDGTSAGGSPTTFTGASRTLTNPLLMGSNGSGAQHLDGRLAEVGIWVAVLDTAEVAALAKGCSPALIRPASLRFYAPLIRDGNDLKIGLIPSVSGTVNVVDHPRVVRRYRGFIGAAATSPPPPPAGFVQRRTHIHLGTRTGSRQVA